MVFLVRLQLECTNCGPCKLQKDHRLCTHKAFKAMERGKLLTEMKLVQKKLQGMQVGKGA